MAENNHQRTLALRAPRGVVFDRDVQRAGREPPLLQHLDRPRAHQGSEPHDPPARRRCSAWTRPRVREIVDRHRREPSYRPITIVQDATLAQVAAVTARRLDFELPDVVVEQVPTRRYPETLAAHLFGYVGEVNDAQVAGDDALKSGDIVGQSGIEKIYNALLMGEDGARRVVVNSVGREIRTLEEEPADRRQAPAADASTTTCRRRSKTASSQLGFNGAAVVLDPANGDVLAFTSRPAYDPNAFAAGHRSRDVGVAQHRRDRPLQRSRDSGALFAGIDVQDGGRDGGARRRRHHAGLQGALRRARDLLRPPLQVLEEGRPRHDRSAPRDRAVVQRLLLHGRQHDRHRQDPQVGDAARPRREERHRPAERGAGARAVAGVEAASAARRSGTRARRSRCRSARARCR